VIFSKAQGQSSKELSFDIRNVFHFAKGIHILAHTRKKKRVQFIKKIFVGDFHRKNVQHLLSEE
jgi:hypothetical protein